MAQQQPSVIFEGEELPEGAQELPQEVQAEIDRLEREAMEKVLDKVAEDPAFRQQLLENPEQALQGIGVGDQLDQTAHDAPSESRGEVAGQSSWYSYWTRWGWHWYGHWGCRRLHRHHYL